MLSSGWLPLFEREGCTLTLFKISSKKGSDTDFSVTKKVFVFLKIFLNSPLLHVSTFGIILKGHIIPGSTRKKGCQDTSRTYGDYALKKCDAE